MGKSEFLTAAPRPRTRTLERPTPRRGLTRVEAAMYLGISPSKFDELRHSGQIGPAKIIGSRLLFDVYLLDEYFDALPEEVNQVTEEWQVAV
jgi:excisionase family DNA binding protein